MPNKNVELELVWKEINKQQKILKKIITVLEQLTAEIDKIKADNLAHHKDRTKSQ